MKTSTAIFSVFTILCLITGLKVSGQVVAIGHVTAEVVESVSASSKAITGFNLNNNSNNASTAGENGLINADNINLGTITINSGANMACNMVLHSAELKGTGGDSFTIDATLNTLGRIDTMRADGPQTIQINGTAHNLSAQPSGLYEGTYTMVFAYN